MNRSLMLATAKPAGSELGVSLEYGLARYNHSSFQKEPHVSPMALHKQPLIRGENHR
jgi:hypothetical protein